MSAIPHEECSRAAHLPALGREPTGGKTTKVCDTRPVQCQTNSYLPSRKASPPLDPYQIMLLGDTGTCVCVCEQLAQ